MTKYLLLNFATIFFSFGLIWGGEYQWLLLAGVGLSIFSNIKAIGFIKKYWNSKKYFGKSVLGTLILTMEDCFLILYIPALFK